MRVRVGWWGWGDGREGFPLSHKADGADLSGCSQSQRGQVYPAAMWKSRDSSPSLPPLRILLLAHYLPQAKLQTFVCTQHKWHMARAQTVAKFRLVIEQA